MRAAVNLVVSSLLIALGTSLKLPLSTTFVTFTVAMGTSLMDRAWDRESAVGRVTGMMSVMGGWLLTAVIAFAVCFAIALVMHYGSFVAMILLSIVAMVIIVRSNIKFNKKAHEKEKNKTVFDQMMSSNDPDEVLRSRNWTMSPTTTPTSSTASSARTSSACAVITAPCTPR